VAQYCALLWAQQIQFLKPFLAGSHFGFWFRLGFRLLGAHCLSTACRDADDPRRPLGKSFYKILQIATVFCRVCNGYTKNAPCSRPCKSCSLLHHSGPRAIQSVAKSYETNASSILQQPTDAVATSHCWLVLVDNCSLLHHSEHRELQSVAESYETNASSILQRPTDAVARAILGKFESFIFSIAVREPHSGHCTAGRRPNRPSEVHFIGVGSGV
jgi:hypothetical protein